jgi:hypothetical protein
MITLGEKQNGINILHIIIGPETLFQFNLTGQSVMDVTEFAASAQAGEKCVIVVNRCDSEEELLQALSFHKAKMQAMEMANQIGQQMFSPSGQPNHSKEEKKKGSGIKCPKCGAPNSAIVIDEQVTPCSSCKKIDQGLQSGEIPPIPPLNDLTEIKKIVTEKNPEQRKSVFKFYSKEPKPTEPPKKGKK